MKILLVLQRLFLSIAGFMVIVDPTAEVNDIRSTGKTHPQGEISIFLVQV